MGISCDADGALLALSESNSADMDDAVRQRRALITARVEATRGNTGEAVATLSGNQTLEAEEARAAILELRSELENSVRELAQRYGGQSKTPLTLVVATA